MCHLFWTTIHHMQHSCDVWRSEIVPFMESLGIADKVLYLLPPCCARTKFQLHNHVVLYCTKPGVQWIEAGYVAKISS